MGCYNPYLCRVNLVAMCLEYWCACNGFYNLVGLIGMGMGIGWSVMLGQAWCCKLSFESLSKYGRNLCLSSPWDIDLNRWLADRYTYLFELREIVISSFVKWGVFVVLLRVHLRKGLVGVGPAIPFRTWEESLEWKKNKKGKYQSIDSQNLCR